MHPPHGRANDYELKRQRERSDSSASKARSTLKRAFDERRFKTRISTGNDRTI